MGLDQIIAFKHMGSMEVITGEKTGFGVICASCLRNFEPLGWTVTEITERTYGSPGCFMSCSCADAAFWLINKNVPNATH